MPPNKPMNRSGNGLAQLTLGGIWRHDQAAGSEPVSAVAVRLSPIRWTAPDPGYTAGLMQKGFLPLLMLLGLVCFGRPAEAITIEGVEFIDYLEFNAPLSGDLLLSTSEDIYVFALSPIVANVFDLTAGAEIHILQALSADTVSLCAKSAVCESGPFTFDRDLIVTLSGPIGNLTLLAGGSIVVAAQAIPEPSTALLLAMGLGSIAGHRRQARRGPTSRCS